MAFHDKVVCGFLASSLCQGMEGGADGDHSGLLSISSRLLAFPGKTSETGQVEPASRSSEEGQKARQAVRIEALRGRLAKLERTHLTATTHLPLWLPQAHSKNTAPSLICGALNEIAAAVHGDRPAAFAFAIALTAATLDIRSGPAVLVVSRRGLADFGAPYGHGLARLGLDVGRLLLIETKSDKDALWALEQALRSPARPAMVAGAVAGGLGLTPSRRLNLAAALHGTPLVVLRAPEAVGTSAAVTRWRIASASAARDRFGALAQARWDAALERCRNGRTGKWLIEWDHVAHRFRVVESVADRAPDVGRANPRRAAG
jgi:protein ImuA